MSNPSDQTRAAALWLVAQKEPPRPAVPELMARFNLTTKQACEVCRLASDLRRAPR